MGLKAVFNLLPSIGIQEVGRLLKVMALGAHLRLEYAANDAELFLASSLHMTATRTMAALASDIGMLWRRLEIPESGFLAVANDMATHAVGVFGDGPSISFRVGLCIH